MAKFLTKKATPTGLRANGGIGDYACEACRHHCESRSGKLRESCLEAFVFQKDDPSLHTGIADEHFCAWRE